MTAPRWNIVFLLWDDSLPDQSLWMPYLSSNPGGNWVDCVNGFAETPLCGPTRAVVFTGQSARRNGVESNKDGAAVVDGGLVIEESTQAVLRAAGYHTAHVGKYLNGYPWQGVTEGNYGRYVPAGWSAWRSIGRVDPAFSETEPKWFANRVNVDGTFSDYAPEGYHVTDLAYDLTVEQIETAPEPFFLHVGHFAPHKPSIPATRHAGLYDLSMVPRRPNFNEPDNPEFPKPTWFSRNQPSISRAAHAGSTLSADEIAELDQSYLDAARCYKSLDEGVERVIDALTARGILDRTIIVTCGDNSNLFGEHRHKTKGVPYEESIRCHIKIRWPGAEQRTEPALVSFVDFAATFVDLAGVRLRKPPDGMSLRPLMEGDIAPQDWRTDLLLLNRDSSATTNPETGEPYPHELGPGTWEGVRTSDGWKYVFYTGEPFPQDTGDEELYDLNTDPYELTNLAAVPEHAARLAAMRRRLRVLLAR